MKRRTTIFGFLCLVIFLSHATSFGVDTLKKVNVFILAGQSNMEGKAKVELLEYQINQPKTRDFFKHLKKDGRWVERDDVWIYLGSAITFSKIGRAFGEAMLELIKAHK